MPKAKPPTDDSPIILPTIRLETVSIPIIGDTSLITNAMTEERKDQIEQAAMKKAHRAKPARDPVKEYEMSKYILPDGGCGHPAAAFKRAGVEACRLIDGFPMTEARVLFHVLGDLVPINGDPKPRRDMVPANKGGGGSVPCYRAEFSPWSCTLTVRYYANKLTLEQIVNLFNLAGLGGVGCWRPSAPMGKSGNHGMFHVATT